MLDFCLYKSQHTYFNYYCSMIKPLYPVKNREHNNFRSLDNWVPSRVGGPLVNSQDGLSKYISNLRPLMSKFGQIGGFDQRTPHQAK